MCFLFLSVSYRRIAALHPRDREGVKGKKKELDRLQFYVTQSRKAADRMLAALPSTVRTELGSEPSPLAVFNAVIEQMKSSTDMQIMFKNS